MQNAEPVREQVMSNDGEYEAPRIELVVSEDGMRREVHYAGNGISAGQGEPGDQGLP
ncbi:MAG: hypothetical protein ACSLFK_08350 [Gemmatimonadaceae bacterium]